MLLEAKAGVNMRNNVSESCSSDGLCALAESSIKCTDYQLWCIRTIHVLLVDFHILCAECISISRNPIYGLSGGGGGG